MPAVHDYATALLQACEQQRAALLRDDLAAFAWLLDRGDEHLAALDCTVPMADAERRVLAALLGQAQVQAAELTALLAEHIAATARELTTLHQGYAAARRYLGQSERPHAGYEFRG